MKRKILSTLIVGVLVISNFSLTVCAEEAEAPIEEAQMFEQQRPCEPNHERPQQPQPQPDLIAPDPELPADKPVVDTPVEETVNADGVYVLKQGVSDTLDISTSTANSYWTQVDTTAQITFKEDGELVVVKDADHTAADITINEEEFLKALNYAVTGAEDDDTYTWEYNKVILENNGYHLDCIAYVPEYTVTFVTGTEENIKVGVLRNDTVSAIDYMRDGYEFLGYYVDGEFTTEYDFSNKIKADTDVYLAWVKIEPDEELEPEKPVVDPEPKKDETQPEQKEDTKPAETQPSGSTPPSSATSAASTPADITVVPTVSKSLTPEMVALVTAEVEQEETAGSSYRHDGITILDEDVPLAGGWPNPKTGDDFTIVAYALLFLVALGFLLIFISVRKMLKEEDVDDIEDIV